MTAITIDVKTVAALAGRLESITPARLGGGAVRAVNEVITQFEADSRQRITERVNLTGEYVKSKTDLVLATQPADPTATLTVAGPGRPAGRGLTILGRYGPEAYRGGRSASGGRAAVRGRRSAGVAVEISKGAPVFVDQWFLMRLRDGRGAGDGRLGVFVRTTASGGKPVHIYGPSPYSLVRQQIDRNAAGIGDDLQRLSLNYVADQVVAAL